MQPVQPVGHQEVANLVASVVEHQRPPVGVLAPAGVGVLVQRRAVQARECEPVTGEVRRHPVEDHPHVAAVQGVDHRPQVVRVSAAGSRRVVRGHLVAPRSRERVPHHREQLDVGEAHLARVVAEFLAELAVGEGAVAVLGVPPPRGQVHLVDRHRLGVGAPLTTCRPPCRIVPLVPRGRRHHRARPRRQLGPTGHRVGLLHQGAVRGADAELVERPGPDAGEEELPHPGRSERAHRVQAIVPGAPVAHHAHRVRRRRPYRERRAVGAVDRAGMRAKALPEAAMASLADEVQVDLAQGG